MENSDKVPHSCRPAISLASIAPVANAATFHNGSTVAGEALGTQTQQYGAN
jgi:hypothetical protein